METSISASIFVLKDDDLTDGIAIFQEIANMAEEIIASNGGTVDIEFHVTRKSTK